MENNIVSLGIKVKGEIVIEKVVDDVIIDTIKAYNTWLDCGTQTILWGMFSGYPQSVYVNVSSYSGIVNYTDTVIPNVLVSVVGTRTYESTQIRHKFVAVISAPVGAPRTINAVGLSLSSGGVSPYCYTVLSTPVVQQTTETLYVYYYVYVQPPLVDGFGYNGYDSFAGKWFGYLSSPKSCWRYSLTGDVKITEYAPSIGAYNDLGNTVNRSGYYSMGWTGQVGDSGNLTTMTGFIHAIGLNTTWLSQKVYDASMIGRVWAKAKVSTALFFDPSNLPLGWGKAINIRAEVDPYVPTALVSSMSAQISVSGAVGIGKYYLTAGLYSITLLPVGYLDGGITDKPSIEVVNKNGQDWLVVGMCNVSFYQYPILINSDTGGYRYMVGYTSTLPESLYIVYDNFVGLENSLFAISITAKKLLKSDMTTTLTSTYDIPYKILHAVGLSIDNLIYCWADSDYIIFTCNPFTGVSVVTSINVSNYWMGYLLRRSWGGYDQDRDWIMMEYDRSLVIYDRLSINNVSNFSGVANFSGTTIKDWSRIMIGDVNGVLSYSGGKLLLTTSTGYMMEVSSTVTATQLGQSLNAGIFEVTCCIESFDPTVNFQEIGLLVSSVIGPAAMHKRIGKQFNNSVKQLVVKSNATGQLVNIEATVTFTGVYTRFKITRDGSDIIRCYYSTDPISTPDSSATWVLLGNQIYTLSGKVSVGLYGLTKGGATVGTGTISDFRVNSGVIDKTINTIYLKHDIVNEGIKNSRYGSVLKKDGYYYCLTTTHIVMLDAVTLNIVSEVPHNGALVDVGYMCDSDFYATAVLYRSNRYTYVKHLYYDSILNTWISAPVLSANFSTVPYKQGLVSITSTYVMTYNIGYVWDWNGSNWVLTESASPVGKLTHVDWQNIPFGLQLRCCAKVSNPNATFNTADNYTWMFCKNGIIKDNVQYVTNVGFMQYFGNAHFAEESYTGVAANFTLQAKINNAATWLTTDLGMAYEFKFKDHTTGAYLYWNSILTSNNVDSVTSKSEFTSNDFDINWAYNYYKGNWVKFTTGNNNGIARQIIEYDGYNKKFVTNAFPGDIVIGDSFDIVSPADATRVQGTGDDSIPTMTSNTTPSGICSASYDNVNAYKAFDANTGTYTGCPVASLPYTITYEFPVSKIIRMYAITGYSTVTYSPKNWTFEAWDGSNWIILDTQSNVGWAASERKLFLLTNVTTYIKYRLVVTAIGSGGTNLYIYEIEMYEISANSFYLNESVGNVYVSVSNIGQDADLKYVWVGRSW